MNKLALFTEIIQKFSKQLCVTWLEEELSLGKSNIDRMCVCSMVDTLDEDGGILQNIRRLGKEDLYAEWYLLLNLDSSGSCYDYSYSCLSILYLSVC
nr:DUF3685 domain-containing protein [Ipomoea batatas]GME01899.1 DUF3685 domain-containing protein [Ipomoea batatas]